MANKVYTKKTAKSELHEIVKDCVVLIDKCHNAVKNTEDKDTARLMATPILYSAWERLFRLGILVGLRLKHARKSKLKKMKLEEYSFWLLHQPFLQSFKDKKDLSLDLLMSFVDSKGQFQNSDVTTITVPSDDKVILTKSNVGKKVVELNGKALGFSNLSKYSLLDLSKLDELVGKRNAIGHGQIITPPGEREFEALIDYTKSLMGGFEEILLDWYSTIK